MKQAIYGIDLKELREPFDAFCDQQGFTSRQKADYVRGVLRAAIGSSNTPTEIDPKYAIKNGDGGRKHIRMSLDPVAYDTLLITMEKNSIKSLPAFLEALALESLSKIGVRAPSRLKGLDPSHIKMFSESNGNLNVIKSRVRSITDQLKTFPEYVTATQLELITELPDVIRQHTLVVAKALASLNPQRRIKARKRKLKE